MFEKTLTDVVKGIRASKRDTSLYISQCIAESKTEINSSDMFVKANALQKLTFLQMMGYSMSWASFATIEVMSSPRFAHKRIGYLAASQGFNQHTDVILLTTNSLKKELRGAVVGGGMHGVYEAGLAVNCISNIVTEDLGRDLLPDLTNLISHPQPYLRKKAILCLYKVFVKYPQGLRLTFQKLQQCLNDPNPSVVSCAVNVITELSDKNPKNYLHLAPAFFELLTSSSNNWMLIKVVKLLGSLVPEEPRLARKLLEPLAAIVKNTQAKSLLFEAVYTITLCLPYCRKSDGSMPAIVPEIVALSAQTLFSFVEEPDQNLKYLGLVGFGSLMQSHPKVLSASEYRPLILACLSDPDVTIRSRALDLLTGMASRRNLMELVSQLLKHVEQATGSYKYDLVAKIVEMCASEKYSLLQDFGWYLDVLFQLGHMRGIEIHADLLRSQITDVALRVLPVRVYAVRRCVNILLEEEGGSISSEDPYGDNGRGRNIMPQILPAIAWIIGEYSDLIREALSSQENDVTFDNGSKGNYHAIIQALTDPSNSLKLPAKTQKDFVQASMKVFAVATGAGNSVKNSELEACVETIQGNLPVFVQSTDIEVAGRSFTALELLKSLGLVTGGPSSMPGLDPLSDDDDEGSPTELSSGDLLGMSGGKVVQEQNVKTSSQSTASLAAKCKRESSTLNYLLKPSPMKPTGAKAQRKKRQSPTGTTIDLSTPVDLSVFDDMIEEEASYRVGRRLTIDGVSFTQQCMFQTEVPSSIASPTSLDASVSRSPMPGISSNGATHGFQDAVGGDGSRPPMQREGDPFYLNSQDDDGTAVSDDSQDNDETAVSNEQNGLFGTIQLLDSDGEDEGNAKKHKKKKHRKQKRSKSKGSPAFCEHNAATGGMAIYASDDDEEDEDEALTRSRVGKKKSNVFSGLAKVDLTKPLGEHEVMPELKHRVVPERPPEEFTSTTKKKKKKKEKKAKKGNKKSPEQASQSNIGNLLDLNFSTPGSSTINAKPPPASMPAPSGNTNMISSAFDDLLGLETQAAPPQPPAVAIKHRVVPERPPDEFTSTKKKKKKKKEKKAKKANKN